MGYALANEGVPQPCFVWLGTLYSQPLIKLPHMWTAPDSQEH
jgi:hypothetical protein